MRQSPSIIPGVDHDIYLVEDDFGRKGRCWRETDVEDTDLDTVIADMLDGQFENPVRVVGFNTAEYGRGTCRKMWRTSCRNGARIRAGFFLSRWSSSSIGTRD